MPPHLEGCIWDGFISRSMPRVRHGVAGLTWAGVGIPGQGTQANIHLSSAPAHQRIGLAMADFQRTAKTQSTSCSCIAPARGGASQGLGESSVSFPTWARAGIPARRGRPPRLTASAPAHQGMVLRDQDMEAVRPIATASVRARSDMNGPRQNADEPPVRRWRRRRPQRRLPGCVPSLVGLLGVVAVVAAVAASLA